jgi:hypothetical protein
VKELNRFSESNDERRTQTAKSFSPPEYFSCAAWKESLLLVLKNLVLKSAARYKIIRRTRMRNHNDSKYEVTDRSVASPVDHLLAAASAIPSPGLFSELMGSRLTAGR